MTDSGKTSLETRVPDVAQQKPMYTLRFASASVGSLKGRSAEVADMLHRRMVDVGGI